jgi:hypothetical protein
MPFQPTTYRVLIAAPGDLHKEIDIAERVIHRMRLTVGSDLVRLEPLYWKKDSRPDIHMEPQDAINEQLVDDGDMILAMFWTRRGTKTRKAESGTEEEVERFRTSGRPGMVYFSNRVTVDTTPPNATELRRRARDRSRIEKVRAKYHLQDATHTSMFTGEFSTPEEFESMLPRHLEGMVRDYHLAAMVKVSSTVEVAEDHVGEQRAKEERQTFETLLKDDRYTLFQAKRNILALSLIPARPLRQPLTPGRTLAQRCQQGLAPMRLHPAPYAFDGTSIYYPYPSRTEDQRDGRASPQVLTELTEFGSVFAMENLARYSGDIEGVVEDLMAGYRMNVYLTGIVESVRSYLGVMRDVGVTGTVYVGISFLKFGKMRVTMYDQHGTYGAHRGLVHQGGDIVPRPIAVNADMDVSTFDKLQMILLPVFRRFWHTVGSMQVPLYDQSGGWLGFSED